jgi:hypothetical protein
MKAHKKIGHLKYTRSPIARNGQHCRYLTEPETDKLLSAVRTAIKRKSTGGKK